MMKKDTIVAIATGLTDSGIGIIRISGKEAVMVGNALFCSPSGKKILKNVESHVLKYGFVVDEENNDSNNVNWKNLHATASIFSASSTLICNVSIIF